MMDSDDAQDATPPAIVLDEHDAAAVAALLIRTVRIDDELKRDRDLVTEANARIAANAVARSKTITAFGVFGFDTGDGLWSRVVQSLGSDAYRRAIAIGRGYELPKLLEKMHGPEAQEDPNEDGAGHATRDDRETGHQAPRIKDAILDYLQAAGDVGVTARAVRQHLTDVHNLSVHEKTPGMTLYRLLKDGLVMREGRTWRVRAATGDNENEAPKGDPEIGGRKGASETAQ